MRQWRIGTFSMGLSLIILGAVLVLANFFNWNTALIAISWWPAILIVLGIEILVYLIQFREKTPILKYDILSILFIGIIGTVGVAFFVVQSTGILAEIQKAVHAEEKVETLPVVKKQIPSSISKIVIHPAENLNIETNSGRELTLFGIYETMAGKGDSLSQDDIVQFVQTGDTLHVQFLSLPDSYGINHYSYQYDPTLSIPEGVDVEIKKGFHNRSYPAIKLHIDELKANWTVNSNIVWLYMNSWENLTIEASGLDSIEDKAGLLDLEETKKQHNDKSDERIAFSKTFGEGEHRLKFIDVEILSIYE